MADGGQPFFCSLAPTSTDRDAEPDPDIPSGLVVHPLLWTQLGTAIPGPLLHRARHRSRFLPGFPIIWTEEPGTGILAAFWARRSWLPWLRRLRAGRAPPPMPPQARRALRRAGILVEGEFADRRRARWRDALGRARSHFAQLHYAELGGLLAPMQRAALADYLRRIIANNEVADRDRQCPDRAAKHNEETARFFHHQLKGVVEEVVGEAIRPSYAYLGAYRPGARLARHLDRAQCEFTVSMLVDYRPTPSGPSPWPLELEVGGERVCLHQRLGDALLFKGREIPHGRPRLMPGHFSTSLFFHYVPASFRGAPGRAADQAAGQAADAGPGNSTGRSSSLVPVLAGNSAVDKRASVRRTASDDMRSPPSRDRSAPE